MKNKIIAPILILMSFSSTYYCCEIINSLKGRTPMVVPMTESTHFLFIVWTIITIIAGVAILIRTNKTLSKSLALVSVILATSSLSIWLIMIYLKMLQPYELVHNI